MNSFSHITVTLAGELDARMQISDQMLCAIPNSEVAIESFCQNFNDTPAAFESRFTLRSMPHVVIHWRLAGNGAGLAQLFCEGDTENDMLLLLSGIDRAADEAAIRAAEVWISEPPRSPKNINVFQDIRRAPLPLLVSISKSRFAEHGACRVDRVDIRSGVFQRQPSCTNNFTAQKRSGGNMKISRRQFIIHTAATTSICARITSGVDLPSTVPAKLDAGSLPAGVIDAGPVIAFADDKVYDSYRPQGLFVIRRDKQFFALSSVCTRKGCKVRVQDDQSYLCKCHGSIFDRDGRVTKGPAKRDLPRLAVAEDTSRHLLVDSNQQLKI